MPSSPDDVLAKGSTLQNGRYVIEATLGQGGFGITYRASDTQLGRMVAIKEYFISGCRRGGSMVFYPSAYTQETWGQRVNNFINEARVIARVRHRHSGIVGVFDHFEENDTAYMVMEFIEGVSLMEVVASRGKLPEAEALRYIDEVGAALTILHANNVLHRDIKPSNIMVDRDGHAVLIDFGAAREYNPEETMSHTVIASIDYSAPEQFQPHAHPGPYTDIYSLAATCYNLLTGKRPEIDENRRLEDDDTIRPEIMAALKHAMAYLPADRPQSVPEFLTELTTRFPPKKDESEVAPPSEIAPPPDESTLPPKVEAKPPLIAARGEHTPLIISPDDLFGNNGQTQSGVAVQRDNVPLPSSDTDAAGHKLSNAAVHDERGIEGGSVVNAEPAGESSVVQQPPQPPISSPQPPLSAAAVGEGSNEQAQPPVHAWTELETPDAPVREEDDKQPPARRGGKLIATLIGGVVIIVALVVALVVFGAKSGGGGSAPPPTSTAAVYLPVTLPTSTAAGGGAASPTTSDLTRVYMVSTSEGWAVGDGGTILHYSNGNWTTVNSPANQFLWSVYMVSATDGWAVGNRGTILHYSNGNWTTVSSPSGVLLTSVYMVSASEGWAVGYNGTILHYSNGNWARVNSPTSSDMFSVHMVSASEGWAVGGNIISMNSVILRYSNGNWTTVNSPTDRYLSSVYMVSASEGWAVGYNDAILHYSNGNWTWVNSPTAGDLHSVYMVSASEGWAVGDGGTILHYSNGSWTTVNSPTNEQLFSVYMVSASEGWAVGGSVTGTILHYQNGVWGKYQ
ncbi:MAG: hypothetical protein DLM69_06410 [Candidatus Chloroheliales bacterium]|nr:MAG: hypothetical protein DLM69_06410 [Chloroflexota bacterium]